MAPESHQHVAAHRSTKRIVTRGRTAVTLATATVGSLAVMPGLAQADPAPTVQQVKDRVDALHDQAEQATEAYDKANDQLSALQHKVDQIQSKISLEQGSMDRAQTQLGTMAAAQYKAGGMDDVLKLMLASSPDTYLQQASALSQASTQQADTLRNAQDAARQLTQDQGTAKEDLAALQKVRDELAAHKKDIEAKEKAAQDLLNTLTQKERDQLAQIEAQQNVTAAAATTPASSPASSPSSPTDTVTDVPASGRAAVAVAFAQAQLGKPYIPAGSGPYGFDCSGLTMAAWGAAGVKLSHGSSDQAHQGKVVALKDIQPGDLVIYYASRHHVGIYVGNGKIIHAAHSGTKISYAPVGLMPISIVVRPG